MKVIIVRHGQTNWNRDNILQGQKETTLNEDGIGEAKILKKELESKKISKVYCSPLIRTKQTCDIILEDKNIEVLYEDGLKERSYGILEGTKGEKLDLKTEYWDIDNNNKPTNGESIKEFFERVHKTYKQILNENKDEEGNILLITHSGVVIAIEIYEKGITGNTDYFKLGIENCESREYNK